MFNIVGVQLISFKTKEGKTITGYNVWFTEERKDVDGITADRVFVSDRVCNQSNYTPHVGDLIDAFAYNKFGSLYRIYPYLP